MRQWCAIILCLFVTVGCSKPRKEPAVPKVPERVTAAAKSVPMHNMLEGLSAMTCGHRITAPWPKGAEGKEYRDCLMRAFADTKQFIEREGAEWSVESWIMANYGVLDRAKSGVLTLDVTSQDKPLGGLLCEYDGLVWMARSDHVCYMEDKPKSSRTEVPDER